MNEINHVHTLADAVKIYRERQAEITKKNEELDEQSRQKTLKALTDSGLIPLRIEERNLAVLEYEGQEIKFRIFFDNYWQVFRQGTCEKCGKGVRTYSKSWSAENIGELIVEPSWEYHNCPADESAQSTPEGTLISALRDALGLNIYE